MEPVRLVNRYYTPVSKSATQDNHYFKKIQPSRNDNFKVRFSAQNVSFPDDVTPGLKPVSQIIKEWPFDGKSLHNIEEVAEALGKEPLKTKFSNGVKALGGGSHAMAILLTNNQVLKISKIPIPSNYNPEIHLPVFEKGEFDIVLHRVGDGAKLIPYTAKRYWFIQPYAKPALDLFSDSFLNLKKQGKETREQFWERIESLLNILNALVKQGQKTADNFFEKHIKPLGYEKGNDYNATQLGVYNNRLWVFDFDDEVIRKAQ